MSDTYLFLSESFFEADKVHQRVKVGCLTRNFNWTWFFVTQHSGGRGRILFSRPVQLHDKNLSEQNKAQCTNRKDQTQFTLLKGFIFLLWKLEVYAWLGAGEGLVNGYHLALTVHTWSLLGKCLRGSGWEKANSFMISQTATKCILWALPFITLFKLNASQRPHFLMSFHWHNFEGPQFSPQYPEGSAMLTPHRYSI